VGFFLPAEACRPGQTPAQAARCPAVGKTLMSPPVGDDRLSGAGGQARLAKRAAKRAEQSRKKANTRDSLQALSKLAEIVDGTYRIVSQPPIVVPMRDLAATYGMSPDDVGPAIREQFHAYRATLQEGRRHLLERFDVVDAARKVVGVGSVGTRAFIVLLQGRDQHDPPLLADQGGDGVGSGGVPAP
jgi:Uncharacterized protein conserved in bacteria (DUF2252)